MSNQPWSCDRTLDVSRVRSVLASQYPDLPARDVRYLAEGWDSQAFEVDGTWVFRFPKRADIQNDLKVEAALLPKLAAHLARSPSGLRIPVFDFVGVPSEHFPYLYAGYRKLIGLQGDDVDVAMVPVARLAARLGRALSDLHAFPAAEALALGVPDGLASRGLAMMRERALARLSEAANVLGPALVARVQAALTPERTPPEHPGPSVLVHNDLLEEHLLLDARTLDLVGVIDWGDVALGDPAVDLVGVQCWLGEDAVHAVLASYTGPRDAGLMDRVRWRAACLGVYLTIFGVSARDERDIARGRRALELSLPPKES